MLTTFFTCFFFNSLCQQCAAPKIFPSIKCDDINMTKINFKLISLVFIRYNKTTFTLVFDRRGKLIDYWQDKKTKEYNKIKSVVVNFKKNVFT